MAEIIIQHENFQHYDDKVEDFDEFLKVHTENIERFRAAAGKVLKDEEGKFHFDYVTKYHQFEPIDGPRDITNEEVHDIEEIYPNCFI